MHFGVFVGLGWLASLLTFIVIAILLCMGLYMLFFTQFGFLVLAALAIYASYKLLTGKSRFM